MGQAWKISLVTFCDGLLVMVQQQATVALDGFGAKRCPVGWSSPNT